eukprot:2347322-Ditylum_brightwellii.AAC.1
MMRGADCDCKMHMHETTPMMSASKLPHVPRSPRSSQSYNGRDCSSRGNAPWMSSQRNPESTPPDTLPQSSHSATQGLPLINSYRPKKEYTAESNMNAMSGENEWSYSSVNGETSIV